MRHVILKFTNRLKKYCQASWIRTHLEHFASDRICCNQRCWFQRLFYFFFSDPFLSDYGSTDSAHRFLVRDGKFPLLRSPPHVWEIVAWYDLHYLAIRAGYPLGSFPPPSSQKWASASVCFSLTATQNDLASNGYKYPCQFLLRARIRSSDSDWLSICAWLWAAAGVFNNL